MQINNSKISRIVNTTKSILRSLAGYDYPTICDISYAQPDKNINWTRLKELGVGIIMRAGQNVYEDSLFRTHYNNAVNSGVLFGIYWFFQPDQPHTLQVKKFMEVFDSLPVKPKRLFVDVEPIVYPGVSIFPKTPELHSYYLMSFLQEVENHTGIKTIIYTRADYWDVWVRRSGARILYNGMPYILPDWSQYPLWIASWTIYSQNVRIPLDWKDTGWKIWQYEGGTGRQDGIVGPVDKNYFNGTQAEMVDYFGGEEIQPMASLYNTTVLQKNRAKIFTYEPNTKLIVDPTALGVDAIILPMGGMHNYNGSHWYVKTEETFKGRLDLINASNIPVMGRFDLDAGSMLKEQHTAPEFTDKPIRDNWILPYLLSGWLDGTYDPHNFDWETVLSGNAKWKDVKAIILQEVETDGYPNGTNTGDIWQTLIFNHVYNHLRFLMDNKMCPDIPIIIYSGGWWLAQYLNQFANMLGVNKNKLYLHLGHWVNFSTATFSTLGEIFAFPPIDSFKFETKDSTGKVIYTYPDGYFERILMHEFTGQFQKVKYVTDVYGNPTTVNLSLWNDTAENLKTFFQIGTTPPIPPIPPVDNEAIKALQAQVIVLTNRANDHENRINSLEANMNTIMKWFNGIIDKIKELLNLQ